MSDRFVTLSGNLRVHAESDTTKVVATAPKVAITVYERAYGWLDIEVTDSHELSAIITIPGDRVAALAQFLASRKGSGR